MEFGESDPNTRKHKLWWQWSKTVNPQNIHTVHSLTDRLSILHTKWQALTKITCLNPIVYHYATSRSRNATAHLET